MKRRWNESENAVSPVIGVMLMLVVTIIIAAVVSAYAGSITGSAEKAPSISMDVTVKNAGSFANSYFEAKVLSISEPISTKNLKLVTSWGKGGNTSVISTLPGKSVTNWDINANLSNITGAPWGYGPGVTQMNSGVPNKPEQEFGNYTLYGGTIICALPAGQSGGFITPSSPATEGYGVVSAFTYTDFEYAPGEKADGMQTVLGNGWEALRTGDVVNVKLVHTPSGATIFEKNVVVS